MAVKELNLTPAGGRREPAWALNVLLSDASAGVDLKAAIPGYRHGIKSITIIPNMANKWFKLMDGDSTLIGPIACPQNVPYTLSFESAVYCERGNALVLKTQEAYGIHGVIIGKTGPPIPSVPFNPSPADGATGVSTDATLTWESVYESVNYKVYFGTTSVMPPLVSEQSELTYDPTLSEGTTYYWRIDEHLDGNSAKGDEWTFTTE